MKLEELIYNRFVNSEALVGHLAKFSESPAVFSPEPPDDNQEGWGGNPQYPKVIYNFDLQANEERRSAGILSVSLLCQNTTEVTPEAIEPIVRDCLRDIILKPEGGTPYCFAWARTDAFSIDNRRVDSGSAYTTIGCDVRFDILEYPSQETSDPDPIMAINKYIKEMYPECLIMGYDRMEEITEATAERPVVYCRLMSVDKSEETNTVAWMDGKIAVHILCPDSETRLKMAAAIVNSISLDGEIIMLDHSPMFIKRLQVSYKSDYLKDGQIFVTSHYGLLRYKAKPHSMTAARARYKQRRGMMARGTSKDADAVESTEIQAEETAPVSEEKTKAVQESVYSVNELAANARKIFGTRQECVMAALRASGKKKYTVSEAKKIVEKFLKKEVK